MGSSQSSHVHDDKNPEVVLSPEKDVRGRKSNNLNETNFDEVVSMSTSSSEEDSSLVSTDDSGYEEDEEGEEEEDDDWEERLRILEDARNMKKVAEFFLHPEKPVKVDATASARCYFDRFGTNEEEEESAQLAEEVQRDLAELRQVAQWYLHPEKHVVCDDPALFGRNYFERPSAPEQESLEDAQERAAIKAETRALGQQAIYFYHPEKSVRPTQAAVARNYFDRASAPESESVDDALDRQAVLADNKSLKKLATDFLHPENKVAVTDACAFGRNYYDRPSAVEPESMTDTEDREAILADTMALKKLSQSYLHPERPVKVDAAAFARCFFDRPSALPRETAADANERDAVLADAAALKKLAIDFMHPEEPMVATKVAVTRSYFDTEVEDQWNDEDADERQVVLNDVMALKKLAIDYLHPESKVVASDPCVFGRNYFSRPSAMEQEPMDDMDVRYGVMADALKLKQLATASLHPENSVEVDATAFARCYYDRDSAVQQEEMADAAERAAVLAEAEALKRLAVDYLHPEINVPRASVAVTRCYFDLDDHEDTDIIDDGDLADRQAILDEMSALKKAARDYLHPEDRVVTSDPFACGRNYFSRPSAEEQESEKHVAERAAVLADMRALKQVAVQVMHPEKPLDVHPASTARCFFDRAIPQEDVEDAEARTAVLADALALRELAVNYLHPEKSVPNTKICVTRNYFDREPTVPQEDIEEANERVAILSEAAALKKLAVDYFHPEVGVVTSDPAATARSYFDRPSTADYHYDLIHSFPPHEDDAHHDGSYHEHLDHFGLDEEMEMFAAELRQSHLIPALSAYPVKPVPLEDKESGKLSRSPSSIFEPI